jgi:hypothetical protein
LINEIIDDIDFMFGDLHNYKILNPIDISFKAFPEECSLAFDPGAKKIIGCNSMSTAVNIGDNGLFVDKSNKLNHQQLRAIEAVNYHWRYLKNGVGYFYNWFDSINLDYSTLFDSDGVLPVFQHHRYRGTKVIIAPLVGYHTRYSGNIPEFIDEVNFIDKKSKISWVGSFNSSFFDGTGKLVTSTGVINNSLNSCIPLSLDELMRFSRFRVVYELKDINLADVYFSSIPLVSSVDKIASISPYLSQLMGGFKSNADQLSSRYLLALDGFDGPSNFFWMMRSKSLVLRQISDWELFGDNRFRPWEHFIPVEPNAKSILTIFDWCQNHPAECVEIVSNANATWNKFFEHNVDQNRLNALYETYHSFINK